MNINDITPRRLNELSADTLASYKKKAGAAATAADAAGDVKTGNQRFSGIVKATKKQFDQDAKGKKTNEAATPAQIAADQARLQGGNQPAAAKPLPTTPPAPPAYKPAAAKPLPTTPPAPPAYKPAAAKPLPTTPPAPPAYKPAAATPAAAAVDPVQQKSDQMQQSLLDRMGKRFGLPPGSSQEQVQAAQQEYLNKNDPAAAAQYQQNMANIEAGGTQAANKPVQLAPTAAPAKPQQSADFQAGLSAQQAGGSPIAIMLAQPTIAGNQAMLDNIAKPLGLPPGSTAAEIAAADAKQPSAKQQADDRFAASQGYPAGTSVEQMAVDNIAKMVGLPAGMTKDEMMAAYAKKTQAARAAVAENYILDELDYGKLIESQLDHTLDDLYETLSEFASPGVAEGAEQEILFYAKIPDGSRVYARVKDEEQWAKLQQQYRGAETKTFDYSRPDILNWLEARGINLRKFAPGMVQTMYPGARGMNEFAPPGSSDGGNDGFSEETLKRLAAQWWNGDEDPRVEQTLEAAGWEIGQDEGYDNGGAFVVRAGDINGNSYISWPAEELEGLSEGALTDLPRPSKRNQFRSLHKIRKQRGLDEQGVAEDSLASMKRLAGVAPTQTQTTPGQRQYRHMPTAVQPR